MANSYSTGQRRQNIFITEERFFGQHPSTVSLLTLLADVWHLLNVLQWLPITLNHLLPKKSTDLTMTYNIMWPGCCCVSCLISSLPSPSLTLSSPRQLWYSSNVPSMVLPQSLCTCCSLCLEHAYFRQSCGLLPHFTEISAQIAPFPPLFHLILKELCPLPPPLVTLQPLILLCISLQHFSLPDILWYLYLFLVSLSH